MRSSILKHLQPLPSSEGNRWAEVYSKGFASMTILMVYKKSQKHEYLVFSNLGQ